ncbi:MAG: deacetylase, partial [Plesiomonas shigelloides]
DYVEFMLHSSEFMPGGSPTFKTKQDIEQLYRDLEETFAWLAQRTQGATLAEYYQYKTAR